MEDYTIEKALTFLRKAIIAQNPRCTGATIYLYYGGATVELEYADVAVNSKGENEDVKTLGK